MAREAKATRARIFMLELKPNGDDKSDDKFNKGGTITA
jgi:hypothetical protein